MRILLSLLLVALVFMMTLAHADDERFIIVADTGGDRVFAVNPFNGVRAEISGPSRGQGPILTGLQGVAWDRNDPEGIYAVCSSFNGDPAVVRIEWGTGNRVEFSSEDVGEPVDSGEIAEFDDPRQIVIIDDGHLAVVADAGLERLIAVYLEDDGSIDAGDRDLWNVGSSALNEPRTLAAEFNDDILVSFRGDFDENPVLRSRIQRIDFSSGAVTDLALLPTSGDLETERGPVGLTVEPDDDILSVFVEFPALVRYEVDSSSSIVSVDVVSAGGNFDGDDRGSGPSFSRCVDVTFFEANDATNDRAYVLDETLLAVFEVDPDDGDRLILSDNGDEGPDFVQPRAMCLGRDVPDLTITAVARFIAGESTLTSGQQQDADINDDGTIDITDLVFLVNLGI